MNNFICIIFTLALSFYANINNFAQMRVTQLTEKQVNGLLESNELAPFQYPILNVMDTSPSSSKVKFMDTKAVEILKVPVILTAMSFAMIPFKDRFFNIRDTYIPDFYKSFDDYTQYLPTTVMLGLKTFGVEGRSSWGRMLTADAFSTVIMFSLVNGIKYSAKVQRPSNGANNAFPSGHAATAFMTATMLHKEYGEVNKWYSIGAYSVATITSVTRVMDNQHWMSDILFGAAIGILSTELGYLISDLIFKEKGINGNYANDYTFYDKESRPSFLSMYTAINVLPSSFKNKGTEIKLQNSGRYGIEGAWYMNKNIGFGGQATIFTADVQTLGNQMGMISGLVGGYFSYPLSNKWRVGSKALVGVDYIKQPIKQIVKIADYSPTVLTGINISYLTNSNLGFKIFADYRHHFKLINMQGLNEFNFGISIDLMFGE